jgi:tetratricopeptide (TPR) repeat protein
VNLAARLNDLAAAGETLVSESIHAAVADEVESEARGATAVAGLPEPVGVWCIRAVGAARRVPRGPLIGRRSELRQFEGVLEACRAGATGQTVLLRGEAGIGKTRLLEEFFALAGAAGFHCHKGLVLDFGVGQGQDALRALVRSLLGIAGDDDRAAGAAAALAGGMVDPAAAAALNDLLDLPQPADLRADYQAMDNEARNQQKQALVAALVRRAAAQRPILLAVEDIHWAAPITLQQLAGLCRVAAECPAILLLTSRIEGDPLDQAWRAAAHHGPLLTLDLPRLRPDEAAAMAATFSDVVARLAEQCVARADGNPLFLEQLLRGAEDYAAAGVPASIQSLVLARMDRLPPVHRQALQAAAVIGQRFALAALRAVLGDPGYAIEPLTGASLVRPEGGEHLFAHALIRDGAYGSLLKSARRELHGRAAAWFAAHDPVLKAEHLDRAEDPGAAQAYLLAARAQAANLHFERAGELADRGLALAATASDGIALRLLQAELALDLGAVPKAITAYREAVATATDETARCRGLIGLAAALRMGDQYRAALDELSLAEPLATAAGLGRELASIHHLRGNLHFSLGDIEACMAQHQRALDGAHAAGWVEGEARALGGLGDACYLRGRMASAHEQFHRCVTLSQANGFGRIAVANRPMTGWSGLYIGPLAEAEAEGVAAVEMAGRLSHYRAKMLGHLLVAWVRLEAGRGDDAAAELEHSLELARRLGARNFEAQSLLMQARVLGLEGRASEGFSIASAALVISRKAGLSFLGPSILGTVALLADDDALCRDALAEGEAILAAGTVSHNHFWFRRDAIDIALARRDWPAVERHAAALDTYSAAEPLPWAAFFIGRGRTLAAIGQGRGNGALAPEIARLRAEGARLGLAPALPALDGALRDGERNF